MSPQNFIDTFALENVYGINLGITGHVQKDLFIEVAKAKYDLDFGGESTRTAPLEKNWLDAVTKFVCSSLTQYSRNKLETADVPTALEVIWDVPEKVVLACKASGIAESVDDRIWTLAVNIANLSEDRLEKIQCESFNVFQKARMLEVDGSREYYEKPLEAYLTDIIEQLIGPDLGVKIDVEVSFLETGDDTNGANTGQGDGRGGIEVILSGDETDDASDAIQKSRVGEPYECDVISLCGLEEIFVTSIVKNDTKRKNDPDSVIFFTHEDGEFTEVARCGSKSITATAIGVVSNFFRSDAGVRFQNDMCAKAFPNIDGNFENVPGYLLITYFLSLTGVIPSGILPASWMTLPMDSEDDTSVPIEKIVTVFTTPQHIDTIREKIGGFLAEDQKFGEIFQSVETYVFGTNVSTPKKKRGRPKKNPDALPPSSPKKKKTDTVPVDAAPKKKRGRPKKNPDAPPSSPTKKKTDTVQVDAAPKKKRGRPKKNPDASPPSSPQSKTVDIPARVTRTVAMDNAAAKTLAEMYEPVSTPVESDGVFISHGGKGGAIDRDLVIDIFTIAEKFRGMTGSDIIHKDVVTVEFLHLLRVLVGDVVDGDGNQVSDVQLMSFCVGEYLAKTSEEVLTQAKRAFRQSFGDTTTAFSP